MAIAIRLARGGMKKRPYYRIVVTDQRNARDGRFLEKLGVYDPLQPKDSPERVKLDTERAAHWLSVGAQPSDRVARFLDAAGVRVRAAKNNPNKGAPGDKAKERAEVRAGKEAERAEAAATAAAIPEPEPVVEPEPAPVPVVEPEATPEPVAEDVVEAETPPGETSPAETADEAPAGDATVEAPAEALPSDVEPVSDLEATTETDASPAGPAV